MFFSLFWTNELIPQEWKEGKTFPLWKFKGIKVIAPTTEESTSYEFPPNYSPER